MSSASTLAEIADHLKTSLSDIDDETKILIGYSGGLDSSVLLHAVSSAFPLQSLLAVHCDHGISEQSSFWANHCKEQAQKLGVGIVVNELRLGEDASEDQARKARYQCFTDHMQRFPKSILLLGHHSDDQVETFLFRLFRGSGLRGLSAIPSTRDLGTGKLFRPLLDISKLNLNGIAEQEGVTWIEDESNTSDNYDRNFIRNKILPLVINRWPNSGNNVLHARQVLREADVLLGEYAQLLINSLNCKKEFFGMSMSIAELESLSLEQRRLVLRYQFNVMDRGISQLSNSDIEELGVQFFNSRDDSVPEFKTGSIEFRRFKGRLYFLQGLPNIGDPDVLIPWDSSKELSIPGMGKLSLLRGKEEQFKVKFRQGSERAKPVSRPHSQSLKKLMQEVNMEPWLRLRTPLIFLGDQLVGVGDSIQCSDDYEFKWYWQDCNKIPTH